MPLTNKALHALKWSILGELSAKAIGPIVFLVLARLLTPEDYGVVAAAMVVISFSQVFSDAGLAKALIQRQDRVAESANVVFWLNLGIGSTVVTILLVTAPLIANFFHDVRIVPVIRALSLQILLAAFSSVHTALLQKDMNFRQLFWVRIVTTGVPGLASIPLALHGMGYWALVAGTLFGQVVQSAVLWSRSPWRPQLGLDRFLVGELVTFGKWAMLSGLIGWFYGWMDAIVVGHYLGAHEMGLYRTGNTFVTTLLGLFFSPLLSVLYSLFSRAHHDLSKLREALGVIVHVIALVSMPMGFALFALRNELGGLVFGEKWIGIGIVIGLMGITHSIGWLVGISGEVFRAVGRPYIETLVMGSTLFIYLGGYLVAVRYGLFIFLEARLILVCVSLVPHLWFLNKTICFPLLSFAKALLIPLCAVCVSGLLTALTDRMMSPMEFAKPVAVTVGCVVYMAAICLFDQRMILRVWQLKGRTSRSPGVVL